jgi:ParB/RepB/Spo0J family partition protein
MNMIQIPIDKVTPSKTNPRTDFPASYISELAASIRVRGIINPLLVHSAEDDPSAEFMIIAGECRWRAAKEAGLAEVPAIVRDDLSMEDILELQLVENLQRKDLSVMEESSGFARLLDMRLDDGSPKWTIDSLAAKVGKTQNYVRQRVRLRRLSEVGQKSLANGTLSFSVARLICRIPSDKLRGRAFEEVMKPRFSDEPLSKRKAEEHIRQHYMVDLKGAPWSL